MTGVALETVHVLVVDDQVDVQRYVAHLLSGLGVGGTAFAASAQQALEAVTAPGARYDLILCDLQLTGRDGVELLHAFADLGVDAAMVVMSGEERRIIETVGQLAQARGLHVIGAEQKPIDLSTMERLLSRLGQGPRAAGGTPVAAPEEDLVDAFRLEQLRMLYQPKVHLRTQRFAGVEALVRWQHPTMGLLLPNAFVPLIERSETFTAALNDFALQAAIRCAARWHHDGRQLPVAINLSASAFEVLDLPERLAGLVEETGLPPSQVTLEVTETQLARDSVRMAEVASRLRLRRFNLAIDDFGTGHSGLSQLQRLPFNELKIDQQFVLGCAKSATRRAMIEASVALARDLQMTTVAEGVEERADWYALSALGVDVVQGYHLARPMSEAGLAEWIRQWEARRQ
jgi:EAL domain-containing protein (putative c-di-GMP-specific phosphodiesterase class I)/ActR/RegA family two-component response regulator